MCGIYFICPDIYFTPAAHNHKFIGDTDDKVTTFGVGNLVLLAAACPTTNPFLATVCFAVQVEVTSLGNVDTHIASVIKFGSFCLGTLPTQI